MLKTNHAKIAFCTLLSFALATLTAQVAQAVPLFKNPCANAGPGNWGENNLNVSIGRAVYRSFFYMGAGDQFSSMTCKIANNNSQSVYQTLRLGFGMGDIQRRSPANIINVYLDGKQIVSRTIAPGEKDNLFIDVRNVSNVAIETICSSQSQYCDRVYFFDASLDRTPASLISPTPTTPISPTPTTPISPTPPK